MKYMNLKKLIIFAFSVFLSGCDLDGDGYIWKADPNIHYADSELREAFKAELENADIPYETYHADGGKEFITWKEKYDNQVKKVQLEIIGSPPPEGRSASYRPQTHNERLKRKLEKANIPFTTTQYYGNEHIVWPPEHKEKVEKIIHREYSDDLYGDAELYIDLGEFEKGIKLLREASNAGNPKAQVALGIELIRGEYIERNYKKAVEFYKLAADQKDISAYVNLGMAYYYGRGIKQDDVKALYWFQKAAEGRETLGMWMVGKFYKEGRGGLNENLDKSQEWYGKAKALGADYSFLENKGDQGVRTLEESP